MINGVRNDTGERLELRNEFETLPEYQWLLQNASQYGFEQSYTEGNSQRSGFPAEAWHWKYIY
jgi:LAS superfamily LD-carboxypeptidase LdcB